MMSSVSAIAEDRTSRWIVLASLALNLFFVGIAGALIVRHYVGAPVATTAPLDRSAAARIERLAATLPAQDAEILRSEFRIRAQKIEAARDDYRRLLDTTRTILRTEPFDAGAMRTALGAARATRQIFDQLLHEVTTIAAASMSAEGRNKLADWSSATRGSGETNR
jgi:uncharacterized membrane protein